MKQTLIAVLILCAAAACVVIGCASSEPPAARGWIDQRSETYLRNGKAKTPEEARAAARDDYFREHPNEDSERWAWGESCR